MLRIIGLGLALVLSVPLLADEAYDFDKTVGRLPKDIVPTDYELWLRPDIETKQIQGRETVRLEFRSPSATIQFDSADQTVRDVRFDGKPIGQVISDNARQLTTVTLPAPAPAGRHVLSFSYSGILRDDARGLFLQPYSRPDGKASRILSSAFEPTDARLMFPCWDEPAFRARFRLTVTVPANWAAISNMPIRRRVVHGATAVVTFERSPKMPTYLVHLTTGDFARITTRSRGTELGVWAIRGQEQDGKQALANAQQILADYDDYFDYPSLCRNSTRSRSLVALTAAWRTGAPSPTPTVRS